MGRHRRPSGRWEVPLSPASPLRVCFVSHSAGLAGAEQCLLELVRELVADGLVEALVVLPEAGDLGGRLEAAGARVLAPTVRLPWGTRRELRAPGATADQVLAEVAASGLA